jgi:hypothetical protein
VFDGICGGGFRYINNSDTIVFISMLGGSLATTAWRVLKLRMEETASRYEGQLRIYRISSRGQPTMGDPPAWRLGVGPIIPHSKK